MYVHPSKDFKKQKEAEEHAQKLLIAQQLAAAGGAAAAVATASAAAAAAAVSASSPTSSSSYPAVAASFGSGLGSGSVSGSGSGSGSGPGPSSGYDPLDELTEQQRRLLQQYSISPPSETMISADGDQITVHHPREEPKKSRLKLRDFFVAEFGITT